MKAYYLCMVSNSYFQFKQFTIHQQKAAMKVCTDACLFGAWVAGLLDSKNRQPGEKALDIGTGTGLLSLMLAQDFAGAIDAIDIDKDASQEALENVQSSPWNNRIAVYNKSITEWDLTGYDLIISNPPFFEQDLKSSDQQKNLALHDTGLTLTILWLHVNRCINAKGVFALLLPYHRIEDCLGNATMHGFHLHKKVLVHQTEKHSPFRVMLLFGKEKKDNSISSIIIKEEGHYSAAFTALLKEYYLYL